MIDSSKKASGRALAQLVQKTDAAYKEVKAETNGNWASHHVQRTVHFNDIISVESGLVDM